MLPKFDSYSSEFALSTDNLVLSAGTTNTTALFSALDDVQVENVESFVISFSTSDVAVVLPIDNVTTNIEDDSDST